MHLPLPSFITAVSEIEAQYEVIFTDVWGVLHAGKHLFPGALDVLDHFRREGKKIFLISNSPRPSWAVQEQLRDFGLRPEAYDGLITSGDATLSLLEAYENEPFHFIGPERDWSLVESWKAQSLRAPPCVSLKYASYVLCTGLFEEAKETPENYEEILEEVYRRNLPFICANPDLIVHVEGESFPCAGTLAKRLEEKGGKALYAGKPHPPIYQALYQKMGLEIGLASSGSARILAIGDSLYTDILGAGRQKLDTLLVASGIHSHQIHDPNGEIDRAALHHLIAHHSKAHPSPQSCSPTYVIDQLKW